MAYRNFLEGYLTTTCILTLIFLGYYLIAMSYSSSHAIYCRQCWEDKRFVITRRIHRAENLLSTYSVLSRRSDILSHGVRCKDFGATHLSRSGAPSRLRKGHFHQLHILDEWPRYSTSNVSTSFKGLIVALVLKATP